MMQENRTEENQLGQRETEGRILTERQWVELSAAAEKFALPGSLLAAEPYGSGHINDTYRLTVQDGKGQKRYILQRMNTEIFQNPQGLMENVEGVTRWLKRKVAEQGGDPEREALSLIYTKEGPSYYLDSEGGCWRGYLFVEGTASYDLVENEQDFYESAVAFGNFQRLLSDYPVETLHETIPHFHDTPSRYRDFLRAVEEDRCGRAASVQREIRFIREREDFTHWLEDRKAAGELPQRVTHNDTKLNNVLIDNVTHRGICVVDLDTVMPGLAAYDFGDSIRFGASTAAEDEKDLSKVSMSLPLFEVYTKGFLEGCGGALTERELDALTAGARMMTLECGMRFLTDYLEGDHYFKIARPEHNLDRARTQLTLVEDMECKEPAMQKIINRYRQ